MADKGQRVLTDKGREKQEGTTGDGELIGGDDASLESTGDVNEGVNGKGQR